MGYLFTKYRCTVNFDNLLVRKNSIENENTDLEFISEKFVPLNLIEPFINSQEKVRVHLLNLYSEEIETYTKVNLIKLINTESEYLKKGFLIIVEKSTQKIVGRLDLTIENKISRLETLFIEEEFRNRKLSYWLLCSALLRLQNEDLVIEITTNTNCENEQTLYLLNKFNFFYKMSIETFKQNCDKK
jgi:hypothetical protein